MSNREIKKIGEVFSIIRNGASIKQNDGNRGIPITRIETISLGVVNRNKLGYADIFDDKFIDYYLKDGDILMSHINSEKHLGKVALYRKENDKETIIHGMNLMCLRTDTLSEKYAFYYFKSNFFKNQIPAITKKSVNQASFTITELKKLRVIMYSLEEQKKIADELDKINVLIEKRKEQIEKLDMLVKAKFVEMFGDPVKNPMGWEVKILDDFFEISSSKRLYKRELQLEGIPFYRISDLIKKINNETVVSSQYISRELFGELKEKDLVPKEGDILITTRGTLGKCYIVKYADEFYFQDGMISWLGNKKQELSNIFLVKLFDSEYIKNQIKIDSGGATVEYMSINKLKELKILYPEVVLQNQFADFVQKVESLKEKMQKGLEQLEILYKERMQEYFE